MENNYTDSLYDLLGNSYSDNLKVPPLEMNYPGGNNYIEPMNNILTEDCIFTLGEEGNQTSPFMNYRTPSPMLGQQEEYYAQPPMMVTPNNNMDSSQDYHTLDPHIPGEWQDIINSIILDDNSFPLPENDQSSLNLGAAAMWHDDDNDFLLDDHNRPLIDSASATYETRSPLPAGAGAPLSQPTQRQRRPRKTKSNSTLPEEAMASPLPYDQYPRPEDLGVPSPASSTYSDAGSSNDEGGKPRKRRPRVSYSTLTDEERYKRIRDLNNEASRNYRKRQQDLLAHSEQQLPSLLEKNEHLTRKAEALQKLRDQMQHYYTNTFLKHVQ